MYESYISLTHRRKTRREKESVAGTKYISTGRCRYQAWWPYKCTGTGYNINWQNNIHCHDGLQSGGGVGSVRYIKNHKEATYPLCHKESARSKQNNMGVFSGELVLYGIRELA